MRSLLARLPINYEGLGNGYLATLHRQWHRARTNYFVKVVWAVGLFLQTFLGFLATSVFQDHGFDRGMLVLTGWLVIFVPVLLTSAYYHTAAMRMRQGICLLVVSLMVGLGLPALLGVIFRHHDLAILALYASALAYAKVLGKTIDFLAPEPPLPADHVTPSETSH